MIILLVIKKNVCQQNRIISQDKKVPKLSSTPIKILKQIYNEKYYIDGLHLR